MACCFSILGPVGRVPRSLASGCLAALLLGLLLPGLNGCGKKKVPEGTVQKSAGNSSRTTSAGVPNSQSGAAAKEQTCFNCAGVGTVPCRAPGCMAGKVECPGPCIKLTRGNWVHMNVPGHNPNELWIKFPNPDGRTFEAWNQNHAGEVVVYQSGKPVNIGACKVCGGTTRVNCPVCQGAGKAACPICKGAKTVPASWTDTDNPWLNSQPDLVRLKSGRVLLGRVLTNGTDVLIKTRDGKFSPLDPTEL
jgi:hypothetical protein